MKEYQVYLFDWDGTLAQTLEVWYKLIADQYKKYNMKVSRKQQAETFGNWNSPLLFGLDPLQLEEFNDDLNRRSHELVSKAPLYPEAYDVLTELKARGKKIAVLTSSVRKVMDVIIAHHELAALFDQVVTYDDVTNHKPHPECVELALSEFAVEPHDVVMIGDTDKDIVAATKAGVDTVLYYPESHQLFHDLDRLLAFNPTYHINDLRKVLG